MISTSPLDYVADGDDDLPDVTGHFRFDATVGHCFCLSCNSVGDFVAFDVHRVFAPRLAESAEPTRLRRCRRSSAIDGSGNRSIDRARLVHAQRHDEHVGQRTAAMILGLLERRAVVTPSQGAQSVVLHPPTVRCSARASTAKTCAANRTAPCKHSNPLRKLGCASAAESEPIEIDRRAGQALDTPRDIAQGCSVRPRPATSARAASCPTDPSFTNVSR